MPSQDLHQSRSPRHANALESQYQYIKDDRILRYAAESGSKFRELAAPRLCSVLLSALLPQTMLLADRAYDADWIRELARQQGARAIFRRNEIAKARSASARICIVREISSKRFFDKIKQCRRVATRYDKLCIKLAIRIWLRANESTP
jgi:transposase